MRVAATVAEPVGDDGEKGHGRTQRRRGDDGSTLIEATIGACGEQKALRKKPTEKTKDDTQHGNHQPFSRLTQAYVDLAVE